MSYRFLLIFLLLAVCSCEKPSQEILIDNPGKDSISVLFDGEPEIVIGSRRTIIYKTKFGKRTFLVNGQNKQMVYLEEDVKYLLNPLQAKYYVETIEIFSSQQKREEYIRYHPETTATKSLVENIEVEGHFELRDDILMIKDWAFDPSESPEAFSGFRTNIKEDRYVVKNLHRRSDLIRRFANDFNFELKEKFSDLE